MSTSNIIDIVVAAFVLLSVIIGAIRGIVRSIIGLAAFGGSVFAGYILSPMVTPKVVDWLYPRLEDKLLDFAESKMAGAAGVITGANIEEALKKSLENFAHVASWIVISLVAFIIFSIIAHAISKTIEKTPGIKQANAIVGALLGLITSVGICYFLVFAVSRLGLEDIWDGALASSISYNFLLSFVPMAIEKISSIEIQGLGEISLKDLFH